MRFRHIRPAEFGLLFAAAIGTAAAWWLPLEKPDGILGRFDYLQIIILAGAAGLLMTIALYVVAPIGSRRRMAFRLAAAWLGVLLPLGIWEAAAFLIPPDDGRNPWYLDANLNDDGLPYRRPAYIQWTGRSPGDCTYGYDPTARTISFVTDGNGFRNAVDLVRADVVFLGDSYTEGIGVESEESYPRLIAAASGLSVANLGRSGYSPGPELQVLKHYALPLKPSLIVWQLCEGNDLEDSVTWEIWRQSGRPFFLGAEQRAQTREKAWERRSPTFRIYNALRHWPYQGVFRHADGSESFVRFYRPVEPVYHSPFNHPGWEVTARCLREGHEMLKEQNIGLLIVLMPLKERVLAASVKLDPDTRRTMYDRWNSGPGWTWLDALSTLCQELEVPLLDPSAVLESAANAGELPYLAYDTHLSVEGQRRVANEILRELEKLQDNRGGRHQRGNE